MSEEFDIEKLLRAHLLDDQEIPPSGLFDQIDAQLSEKRNKKRFFWWFWIGLSSIALFAILGAPRYFNHSKAFEIQFSKCSLELWDLGDSLSYSQTTQQLTEVEGLQEFPSSTSDLTITSQEKALRPSDKAITGESKINGDESIRVNGETDQKTIDITVKTASDSIVERLNLKTAEVSKSDSANLVLLTKNDSTMDSHYTDSSKIVKDTDTSLMVDQIVSSTDIIPDSTQKIRPSDNPKTAKYGLLVYSGPAVFDVAVFKPYFSSGALSDVTFPSSSYEIGFGIYRQFKERFYIHALANFSALKSQFTYDLMISENDFFSLYELDKQIPLANLDDPESCNCFLAEDASLSYKLNNFAFSLGTAYQVIQRPKFNFGPEISFTGILSTKFISKQSEIILFPINQTEKFKSTRIQFGLSFYYLISDRIHLGISPSYGLQFNNASIIYAKNSSRLLFPLSLKIAFK